jgi:CO/xanthine dehydrogenase Mo-binding subunit
MGDEFGTIGRRHWRVDGIGKVTGRAVFAADLAVPGMLWGKVLLARRPHARIVAIDTRRAVELPGVRAVLTAEDLPHAKVFGVVVQNQPVLAFTKIRQYGDAVAMVAAESREAAARALDLIDVRYEDLPGIFDPEEALAPGAPHIHEPSPAEEAASADTAEGTASPPNLCFQHRVRKGDIAQGLDLADIVLERTYRTAHVEHAYIEPEAILAEPAGDGGVRVTGSIQNLFSTRRSLAAVLGLDLARVTVEHATLGGSFGGKDEVMTQMACRAALLARATGRPVKMVNTREDSFTESYKRHPYVMHYKVGAKTDGRLTAIAARIVADAGAYASMSPFVTWRSAVQVTGPYECPHVCADVYAAYTNNCYTGAMRGFGAPQVNFAIESLMDELADRLECDPLDLRLQNSFTQGSITATGQCLDHHCVSIKEVLERAAAESSWRVRRGELDAYNRTQADDVRRGIGLACSYRGVGLGAEGVDAAGSLIAIQSDGSVIVNIALTDMGQGVQSALALIAAEVLGIDTRRVKCFNVHTGRVPDSGPTVASRSTLVGGQATRKAAEALRATLCEVAAEELGVAPAQIEPRDGCLRVTGGAPGGSEKHLGFDDVVAAAYARGRALLGFGWHPPPKTSWDGAQGSGDAYATFVYSANVAEVAVDPATGKVDVIRVTAVHDVGRAISPAMVHSQIYGGIAMGTGYAVLEHYGIERGVPTVCNLDEYLILTALDMPAVDPVIVENPDPAGPFGAKSVGEPATEIAAPAILNAIAHATGKRIDRLPADLETVLLGRPLAREASARGSES